MSVVPQITSTSPSSSAPATSCSPIASIVPPSSTQPGRPSTSAERVSRTMPMAGIWSARALHAAQLRLRPTSSSRTTGTRSRRRWSRRSRCPGARGSRPLGPSSSRARRGARSPASCRNCASSPRFGDRGRASRCGHARRRRASPGVRGHAVGVDRGQRRHHRRHRDRPRLDCRRAPRARAAGRRARRTRRRARTAAASARRTRAGSATRATMLPSSSAATAFTDDVPMSIPTVSSEFTDGEVTTAPRAPRRAAGRSCTRSCRRHVAPAVERAPAAAGLLDDRHERGDVPEGDDRIDRDVERALGDEQVLPEVADAACPPAPVRRAR